jgi:hypothetical protein
MRTFAALATIGLCGVVAGCSSDVTNCTSDAQCGSGRLCDTGVCKVASQRTIGEACTGDANCSVGSSCATAMPGGLCSFACAGDQCPSGAVCADLRASGSGLFCATACTTQAQCRTGYTCCAGLGACVPAANCPAQNPTSADLNKPCSSPAQCTGTGEICATGPEFPGGACTFACNPADPSTCPANSSCVSTSTGSFCFASCTGSCASVNAQLGCVSGVCRSANASPSCTPTGSAPTPVNGGTVGPANPPSGCVRTVQTGSIPPVVAAGQQKVGNKVTFTVPPGTGTISILSQGIETAAINPATGGTQPPDTVTFRGSLLSNNVAPTLLKDPGGNTVYDDDPVTGFPADPSVLEVFYGGPSPWTGMMTVPNTTELLAHTALQGGLVPGTWQFTVNDFALECTTPQHTAINDCGTTGSTTSTYDVQVLLKPGVPAATGTLDLAFYVVSDDPLTTASTLIASANFTRVTTQLARLYARGGLCIGSITVYDLPSWARSKFGGLIDSGDDSACGDLGQLFTLAMPGNRINFFLVSGFSQGGNPVPIVGIDGSIPAPASYGGTSSSGAAVSGANIDAAQNCDPNPNAFSPTSCGPDLVAYIAAHEGGHFLGLYHTTERHGDLFDPLTDTKKCSCQSCAQPLSARNSCSTVNPFGTATLMSNSFCVSQSSVPECGGGTNLMFWIVAGESTGTLTPQQGQVMRANPVVR